MLLFKINMNGRCKMPPRAFYVPQQIFYGIGALENLTTISGQRAFIVTDPGVRALGLAERVEKLLQKNNIQTMVFDKVEPDPSKDLVWSIFALVEDFKPDIIIGLGGGSSIDAGKVTWVLYEHPDLAKLPFTAFLAQASTRPLHKKAKFIAISTTSGTGSEATRVAVVTDRSVNPPNKTGFGSWQLLPDIAIADPEVTASMPPNVTANTGFDALVHAIECYVLIPPSDLIDAYSIWSSKTIFEWLPKAVANGKDMQAREKMQMASLLAGIAFSNGRLGMVHGLAHELGATLFVPHGLANAYMLCPVFAFFYPGNKARFSTLTAHLGIEGKNDAEKVSNLLKALDDLKRKVGIPLAIKNSSMDEKLFMEKIPLISEDFMKQLARSPAASLPVEQRHAMGVPTSADEIKGIFMDAWNGTRKEIG
jgi:alcohol dehydrogenase class IV